MTRAGHRRHRRAARLGAMVVSGLAVVVVSLPGHATTSHAADAPVSVSVTPTTVTDGQAAAITFTGGQGFQVIKAEARLCRTGVTYQPQPVTAGVSEPNPDFNGAGGAGPNCPPSAISSSADQVGVDANLPPGVNSDTFYFRVGAGVAQWEVPLPGSGVHADLTCGPGSPCMLVVEVEVKDNSNQATTWLPFPQLLTYASDDPFGGCGALADGGLTSGGSDRMSDTWVNWTKGECQLPGRTGSATRASFVGEGDGVKSFASGSADLAYSAGGYDQQMGLAPPDSALPQGGRRPAVNVPIALNAAVFATGGGYPAPPLNRKVAYRDIKITLPELAGFLSGGGQSPLYPYTETFYDAALLARNSQLKLGGEVFDHSQNQKLAGAQAGADAVSWYTTRLLATVVPDAWKVPDDPAIADRAKPRGIDNALALANPPFLPESLLTLSGRPPMRKLVNNANPATPSYGGVWFLTDLETATALGLTPAQIESHPGSSQFVGPTPATMAAAVASMVPDSADGSGNPGGVLIAPATPAAGTAAYPLTMVEYAVAPAQPLLNGDCSTRDKSQALLSGWLKYITGAAGQAALAPGMLPLTPDLQAAAAKAVATVGTAAVTGPCAGTVNAGRTTTTTAATRSSSPTTARGSTQGAGTSTGAGTSGSNLPTGGSPSPANGALPANGAPGAVTPTTGSNFVALPAFAGRGRASYVGTVVAFLGIIALSGLAAYGRRARRSPDTG